MDDVFNTKNSNLKATNNIKEKNFNRPMTGRTRVPGPTFNSNLQKSHILEIDEETSRLKTDTFDESKYKKTDNSFSDYNRSNFPNLNEQREELNKILIEEKAHAEFLNKQKEKLRGINLIENESNDFYQWDALFVKSRPISVYTCSHIKPKIFPEDASAEKGLETKREKQNKKSSDNFIFPVALIDEKEEVINDYITLHKNISVKRKKMEEALKLTKSLNNKQKKKYDTLEKSHSVHSIASVNNLNNKLHSSNSKNFNRSLNHSKSRIMSKSNGFKSNAARPQSVYTQRKDNEVFYLDKAFSDYYIQDEEQFAENFALLHPKIRCRTGKLKSTIEEAKQSTTRYEKVRQMNKSTIDHDSDGKNLKVDQRELNLAGNSKNPAPLLKSIYKQMYPEFCEKANDSNRMYPISNKPLGQCLETIDVSSNLRNKKMKEFYSRVKSARDINKNDKLIIDMYDSNDPQIKMFETEETISEPHQITNENFKLTKDEWKTKPEITNEMSKSGFHYSRPKTALIKLNKSIARNSKKPLSAHPSKLSQGTSFSYYKSNKSPQDSNLNFHSINKEINNILVSDNEPIQKYQQIAFPIEKNEYTVKNYSNTFKSKFLPKSAHKREPSNKNINKNQGLFGDILIIENVNEQVKEEMLFDNEFSETPFISNKPEKPESKNVIQTYKRPNTGLPMTNITNSKTRPMSSYVGDSKLFKNSSLKKIKNQTKSISNKVNNVFFNQYIDLQFKNANTIPISKVFI